MSNDDPKLDPETQAKLDQMFMKVIEPYLPTLQEELREHARLRAAAALGATGQHPDGKMTATDQGELKLAVSTMEGKVIMDFGTPVAWVGMRPEQARAMATALVTKAEEAEKEAFKETMSDG